MPREIISFAPENVTGVEVSGFWRLHMGPAPLPGGHVGIGLLFFKYMGPGSTPVALARLPVEFLRNRDVEEAKLSVARVSEKCLCMGNLEADKERAAEAWRMFQNSGASEKAVTAVVENVNELIEAYWKLRRWADLGFVGRVELQVPSAQTRILAVGDAGTEEPAVVPEVIRPAQRPKPAPAPDPEPAPEPAQEPDPEPKTKAKPKQEPPVTATGSPPPPTQTVPQMPEMPDA